MCRRLYLLYLTLFLFTYDYCSMASQMGQPDCLPQALPQRLVRPIVLLYVGALLRSDARVQAGALVYGHPGDPAAHPPHAGRDLVLEAEEHSAGRGPVAL